MGGGEKGRGDLGRLRLNGERGCGRRILLQEIAKFLDRQSGIPNDTAEGKGVDRVMAWDRQDARAV